MKIQINPLVAVYLKNIKEFISEDNLVAAQEIILEIYIRFEYVKQFLSLGAEWSKRVSFKTNYKYTVLE